MGLEDRDLVFLTLLWGLLQGALAPGTPWGGGLLVAQPTAPCTNMGVGSQSRKEGSVHPKLGGDERQRRGQATLAKDCITEHLEVDAV